MMRHTEDTSSWLKAVCWVGATIWAIPLAWYVWKRTTQKETPQANDENSGDL